MRPASLASELDGPAPPDVLVVDPASPDGNEIGPARPAQPGSALAQPHLRCLLLRRAAILTLMAAAGSSGYLTAAPAPAAPPVEFELITEPGFPLTGSQQWLRTLSDIGLAHLQIREGRPGETGGVTNRGTERSPRYHVKGILTSRNTLRLPGGTFRLSDGVRIRRWVQKLQADGIEGLLTPTGPFGLTSKQLLAVHDQLAGQVAFSTKGKKAREVAARIIRSLPIKVAVDRSALEALQGDETVEEELVGISSGTALAAVLRPLGLVMAPRRPAGGTVYLVIADARKISQSWPIGWPSEKSPGQTLPKLFDFLNVEIDDYVLSDALDAIQQRLNVPLLYDHNSMARHGADPARVKVSLPKGRTFYKKVIDRLLAQCKPALKSELRVDEASQPFLWITTVKR